MFGCVFAESATLCMFSVESGSGVLVEIAALDLLLRNFKVELG